MARRRVNTTKFEIIRLGTKLFLEAGYSATTPKMICDRLDISTGNLTYYFPTKEHLLAILVEMLCVFQSREVRHNREEGKTSLLAVCTELAMMAAMTEESEIAKDIFLAAYSSPMCVEIIRQNDNERAKRIYGEFCPGWSEEQFVEAETLVSGIEYATLMTTGSSASLETRITGALNNIMRIYNVPEEIRTVKIQKVLATDYRADSQKILEAFRGFVSRANEQIFEALLSGKELPSREDIEQINE